MQVKWISRYYKVKWISRYCKRGYKSKCKWNEILDTSKWNEYLDTAKGDMKVDTQSDKSFYIPLVTIIKRAASYLLTWYDENVYIYKSVFLLLYNQKDLDRRKQYRWKRNLQACVGLIAQTIGIWPVHVPDITQQKFTLLKQS